jgi:TonB family protein
MQRTIVAIVLFGLLSVAGRAVAQSEPTLLRPSYESAATGEERRYLLYLPSGYGEQTNRVWPVIFFLHGGGERGNGLDDLDHVLAHGPIYEAWIQKKDLPFIIVAPQLPVFGQQEQLRMRAATPPVRLNDGVPPRWPGIPIQGPILRQQETAVPDFESNPGAGGFGPPEGWWMTDDDLIHILDEVLAEYRADADRVYLTGLSYGGYGTFFMAAAHPERWAAIAPIVGTGDPATAGVIAEHQLPIWIFGGGRDTVVRVGWLYEMARALENAGHSGVRFTVHEDRASAMTAVLARTIKQTPPKYPHTELMKGKEAWVHVTYCIDESGETQNISILDSVGGPEFEQAAIDAVDQWEFEPAYGRRTILAVT